MCISYLVVAMVFFGLTLGGSSLGVNPFVYMVLSGLVEIPSILDIFLVEFFGRKKSGIGSFSLCAVSLLLQPLIPTSKYMDSQAGELEGCVLKIYVLNIQ